MRKSIFIGSVINLEKNRNDQTAHIPTYLLIKFLQIKIFTKNGIQIDSSINVINGFH